MPISRVGPTPPFLKYVVESILIPHSAPPNPQVINAAFGEVQWLEIPSYQRGISWTTTQIEEFLKSPSVLLGNVITASFPRGDMFEHLPESVTMYAVLVDGLQRLAVGTALLNSLHDRVLSTTPSFANRAHLFDPLKYQAAATAPIYQHNHVQFLSHPRRAIVDQYGALFTEIEAYVEKRLRDDADNLANEINMLFVQRQLAIDKYHAFPNKSALIDTFLGINTVRVDLGPVDLLRSYIVERASSHGWVPGAIEATENDFTDVFTRDERPNPELLPFVNIVRGTISDSSADPTQVFPSWSSSLNQTEVEEFLDFVEAFRDCWQEPHLNEIRACGALPFAVVLAHYYQRKLNGAGLPSFLSGGNSEEQDLRTFLRACYRVVLDGRIGRTGGYAVAALDGRYSSLSAAGERLSIDFLAVGINSAVDQGWLVTNLNRVEKKKAARVFNALLLPDRGTVGAFQPLTFGRRATHFQIDHLIPESMFNVNAAGGQEAQTIRNLAPLPRNQNRVAAATSCSSKLGSGGIYDVLVSAGGAHHYCEWLVGNQGSYGADLDDQSRLQPNQVPNVGTERVDHIADLLFQKL